MSNGHEHENDHEGPPSEPEVEPLPLDVGHTPIIITDGSVTVAFDKGLYSDPVGSTHSSTTLFLEKVTQKKVQEGPETEHICHITEANTSCRIAITCRTNTGGVTRITIRGGAEGVPNGSPTIEFDHTGYQDIVSGDRRLFTHGGHRLAKMEIFEIVNGVEIPNPVHVCDLLSDTDKRQITIFDSHSHP